jgi:citrate/tricarballylate utilization protein
MSAPEAPRLQELIAEAQRVLTICNACRYCEGYCAVFPALERRLAFDESEIHYLANLCHNCGACLYACQYAPPHEFKLNFPRVLAQVRKETYKKYAWPGFLASAFERNGVVVAIVTMLSLAFFILFTAWYADPARLFQAFPDTQGSFYAVLPHRIMASIFGVVFAFVILVLGIGFVRFWRNTGEHVGEFVRPVSLGHATWDAAALKYLDGGGDGCTYPDPKPSFARRNCHHLTFYGFLLCFAATVVATIYHYGFGWKAPYAFLSLPVILGTLGGVGLLAGPVGLLWLKHRRDPELEDPTQTGMDAGFLVLLFVTSLSGLLLLGFRETRAMGVLLALHLGAVMALFLTLPYGKFVHALYRFAALARYHVERRRPLSEIAAE